MRSRRRAWAGLGCGVQAAHRCYGDRFRVPVVLIVLPLGSWVDVLVTR